VSAIAKRKEEVAIAGIEGLGLWLKRFAPGLFSKIIRRVRVV
ncbi:MAG: short-chain dehydrogenase, partial [Armatimonadota bacterium]